MPQQRAELPTGGKPCNKCGGEEIAAMEAGGGGASFGIEYRHKPDCPTLFCPHGKRWADNDCVPCDEEPWPGHEEGD